MTSNPTRFEIVIIHNSLLTLKALRGDLIQQALETGFNVRAIVPEDVAPSGDELFANSHFHLVPLKLHRTGLNPFAEFKSLLSLKRALDSCPEGARCISTTIKPVLYLGLLNRFGFLKDSIRLSCIITGLGFVLSGASLRGKLLRCVLLPLYRTALKGYDTVLFQNSSDSEFFRENRLLGSKQKTFVVGSGVDLERFPPSNPPTDSLRFTFIGRVLKEKGIWEFLQAASIVKTKYPKVNFEILGAIDSNPSGIKLEELNPWIQSSTVEYLGFKTDIRPVLERTSCVVLPSYREGIPRVILEAMSSGRAAITTDAPGCRDTVKDGETGFLVETHNAEALARAIIKMVENSQLVSQFGRAARQRAENLFDHKKINQKILNILAENNAQ